MTVIVYVAMMGEGAPGGFVQFVTTDRERAEAWAAESDLRWCEAHELEQGETVDSKDP